MSSYKGDLRSLSVDEIESVDKVCLRFENQWQKGKPPEFCEFTTALDSSIRTATLIELILLDVEYHKRRGQDLAAEYYHTLLPNDIESVEAAFCQLQKRNANENSCSDLSASFPFEKLAPGNEYKIERFLARGGLGEVFLASDTQLNRTVAIKVPRNRDPNSPERMRLTREAKITGKLKHPGIVPVHAAGLGQNGQPYYVMQYAEGQTMKAAIEDFHRKHAAEKSKKFRSPHFRRLLQHLISVCNTAAYAHRQGFIHRDIKPGNIMLGKFGETFLLDWGLAKEITSDETDSSSQEAHSGLPQTESWRFDQDQTAAVTRPGQPIGTPEFASPEQVQGRGSNQDPRSDIYSLGATLYFLITGSRTLNPNDLTDLSTANAIREIAPPREVDSNVPADLNAICIKAIQFDAPNRFQQVSDFSDELERYIADEPIKTRQQTWSNRIRRWMKTNPRTAYSIASGITVALAALAISAWLLNQKASELTTSLTAQQQMNSELTAAKESAEEYARKTELALRTMADSIDQTWFASRKSFSQKEQQLLQEMLDQHQKYAQSIPDVYRTKTLEAEAYERFGTIQMLLGNIAQAIDSFENAVGLLEHLPADAAERIRMTKANSVYQLGALLAETGKAEAGLQQMHQACKLTRAVEQDFPENAGHTNRLAIIQARIGTTWLELGDRNSAFQHLTLAEANTRRLVERFPDNKHFKHTFATRKSGLAKAHLQFSDVKLALKEYQSAVEVFESVEDPDWIFKGVRRGLDYCVACNGFARCLKLLERNDESIAAWQKARDAAEQVVDLYPSFPNAYSNLAVPWQQSANCFRELQNWPLAIEHAQSAIVAIEKAVELAPQQLNYFRLRTVIKKELGLIFHESGDLAAAENALKQSVVAARESFERDPDRSRGIHGNRLEYARTLSCLAKVQVDVGDESSAKSSYERAVKLLETTPDHIQNGQLVADELEKVKAEMARLQSIPAD